MVHAVDSRAARIAHVAQDLDHFHLTGGKVSHIALQILTTVCVVGGVVGCSLFLSATVPLWPAFPIATSLLLAGVVSGYASKKVGEYRQAEALATLREEILFGSLSDIVCSVGSWKNVFADGVLSPSEFETKYRQMVEGWDLARVLTYYKNVSERLEESKPWAFFYTVPHPRESKRKWQEQRLSFEEIAETYLFEDLEKYQVVEKKELVFMKDLQERYLAAKAQENTIGIADLNQLYATYLQVQKSSKSLG